MTLDTNALSAFADDVPGAVEQIGTTNELFVPAIVLSGYRFGIATSRRRRAYEAWLARGRAFWTILSVVEEMAAAVIRQELKKGPHAPACERRSDCRHRPPARSSDPDS